MNKFIGISFVLISTVLYALMGPILKKGNQEIPPFTIMAITTLLLSIFSVIMSLIFEHPFSLHIQYSKIFPSLIFYSLINVVGFWLLIQGYKYMPLGKQSLFGLLSPVFVSIFAYFILGEKLDPKILLSLLIMGFGLFVSFL
jgi:drug/metabolite transporter (DMT)-like permease